MEDLAGLHDIATAPDARRELLAMRASHSRLSGLSPAELAILSYHFTFRTRATPVDPSIRPDPNDGDAELLRTASVPFQIPVRVWCRVLGYSERTVQLAFERLKTAGLLYRWPRFRTARHVSRNRDPERRFDGWRDSRGRLHQRVQVYSESYLTQAGADLLEAVGFELQSRDGEARWLRRGFLGRLARLHGALWRTLVRRFHAAASLAEGAAKNCTPFTATQRSYEMAPSQASAEQSESREASEAVSAARTDSRSLSQKGLDPVLAALRNLTPEGRADGLLWEGGSLCDFAELVHRCWTHTQDVLEAVPLARGRRPVTREQARELRRRGHFRLLRPWSCPGCGARRPVLDTFQPVPHARDCPAAGSWRLGRVSTVWRPILTAREAFEHDWTSKPDGRRELQRIFAPVKRELSRRLQREAARRREPDERRAAYLASLAADLAAEEEARFGPP